MPKSVVNIQTSTASSTRASTCPSVNSYAYSNVSVCNSATIAPSVVISHADGNAFVLDYSVGLTAATTTGVIAGADVPLTTKEIILPSSFSLTDTVTPGTINPQFTPAYIGISTLSGTETSFTLSASELAQMGPSSFPQVTGNETFIINISGLPETTPTSPGELSWAQFNGSYTAYSYNPAAYYPDTIGDPVPVPLPVADIPVATGFLFVTNMLTHDQRYIGDPTDTTNPPGSIAAPNARVSLSSGISDEDIQQNTVTFTVSEDVASGTAVTGDGSGMVLSLTIKSTCIGESPQFDTFMIDDGTDYEVGQTIIMNETQLKNINLIPLGVNWTGGFVTITLGANATVPIGGTAIGTAQGTIAVRAYARAIGQAPLFDAYVVKGEDFKIGDTFSITVDALITLGLFPPATTWADGVLTLTVGDQVYPLPGDPTLPTSPPSQITTVTLPDGAYGIRLPDTHQIIIDSVTVEGIMSEVANPGTTNVSWSVFDTNTNGSRQFQIRRSNFAGPLAMPTGRYLRGGRIYLRIVSGCLEGKA